MELWSSLLNHHLHERDHTSFADPAGCSSYGARHATCKDKAPRERSTQTTPSRNLTLGVMQSRRSRNSSPARELTSLLSNFRRDPAVLSAPPWTAAKASGTPPGLQAKRGGSGHRPAPAAAVPAIPLVPVAKSWTGTSTHAAQTQAQAGTTRAGTQRHVGLAARACTETSMHAAQTQARTQHKPPE